MLHRGDAGAHQLERGIERVEPPRHGARAHAVDQPELERQVRRAKLERRHADMMMRVDQAGKDHEIVAADDFRAGRRRRAREIRRPADRCDQPVLDQHRAVGYRHDRAVIADAADHAAPAHQLRRHAAPPVVRSNRVSFGGPRRKVECGIEAALFILRIASGRQPIDGRQPTLYQLGYSGWDPIGRRWQCRSSAFESISATTSG